jgi:hypothetical protein
MSFVTPNVGYLLEYAQKGGFLGRFGPVNLLARTDHGGRSWLPDRRAVCGAAARRGFPSGQILTDVPA